MRTCAIVLSTIGSLASAQALQPYEVIADTIPKALTSTPGDAARGRRIVADRAAGLCLMCHRGPFPGEAQGTLAPDLGGVGNRLTAGQLRLRLVDARRVNPQTIMPAYYRVDGLQRVGRTWRDRPVLDAQQVEDVVAFLQTLQ